MTESTSSEGDTWWSSWLTTAKEKSMTALNATKRDLVEFVSILGTDTKAAVSGASANIKGLIKETPNTERKDQATGSSQHRATHPAVDAPYDRCQAQLFAIQNTPDTYLSDPKGDGKNFSKWKSSFDIQAYQSEISSLLVSCSHIRALHAQLVPAKVSYESFWQRYFYRVQMLQQTEERRAELMARAKPREEKLQWDEDVEEVASVSISKSGSEHHRSDSSDSFVCVSEEPVNEAGERQGESADTESWESLSHDQEEKPIVAPAGNELEEEKPNVAPAGNESEEEKPSVAPAGNESESSDWENWDD